MSDQLFNDSVMQLVLQFSNPQKRDIQDADKLVGHLDAGLRDIVKNALTAGTSVGQLSKEIQQLQTTLIALQRNAGKAGVDSGVVESARKILRTYTPERVQDVGRITALRSDVGVDLNSTNYALRSALEKVASELQLARRKDDTQQGRFYRATGSSPIGRGLFVDTETAFDPNRRQGAGYRQDEELRYAATAMRQQLVEVTASLFEFSKETGEVLGIIRSYHGLQQPEYYSRNLRLPSGLTPQMLRGQAISPLAIAQMARQADFFVAHNAPFDMGVMSRHVPQLRSMPVLDTMRGIPWRELGYSSRAQQDLLRAHGIDPGQAHRSSSDVQAAIQLLGKTSPLGGPNYMSMLLGSQGPVTSQQEVSAAIRSAAMETKNSLIRKLGEAPRYGYAQPTTNRRNFAGLAEDLHTTIASSVIDSIEGGPTVRGIKGSGGSPEATPQNIGGSALVLGRQLGIVNEFLRNQAVMSGPAASQELLAIIAGQGKYQEGIQAYGGSRAGRQFRTEADKRSGEDVELAMMRGTNTQLRNRRTAAEQGYPSSRGLGENSDPNFYDWAAHHARNMLSQGIGAQILSAPSGFATGEAKTDRQKEVLATSWRPSTTPLGRDWLGSSRIIGPSPFNDEEINSFIAQHRGKSTAPIERASQMAGALGEGDPRFKELTGLVYSAQESNRQSRRSQAAGDPFTAPAGKRKPFGSERGGFNLEDLFNSVFGKSAAGPSRDPVAELKQMRRDDSISRLYTSANKAADALEQYMNVLAPQKIKAANDRFTAAQDKATAKLEQDLGKTDLRSANQQTKVQGRIDALGLRSGDVQDTFTSRSEALRLGELTAKVRLNQTQEEVTARVAALRSSESFNALGKAGQSAAIEKLNQRLTMPTFNAGLASYRRESFEAETPEEAEKLRSTYSQMLSKVVGKNYEGDIFSALPSPRGGAVDTAAVQIRIEAQKKEMSDRKTAIEEEARTRRDRINADFATGRIKSEAARDSQLNNVGSAAKNMLNDLTGKAYDARAKQSRANQKFSLEDEIAEGGGGGRGGGSRGVGGGFSGAARGGLDFGLGIAAFAGAALALRQLTIESVEYAARTQQLRAVTEQMAKTNFIATDSVGAYVNVMKSQNQTTQSAYSTIQRMTQAQLDITKAPALARAAQNISTLTGSDPAETLDRIMMGLVTGYTRQLHMAGMQVSRLTVNRELRGQLGRDPNEFEQRQGLLNAILTESARTAGTYEQSLTTAAGQMARLNVQAQETKNTLGTQFLPVYERAIHLVNSGLRTAQDNPTETSRGIAGGIAGAAGLGTIGTLATGAWAAGAIRSGLTALGPWGTAGALALGAATSYGTYRELTQDPMRLKAQSARESLADIGRAQASLQDATPLGPNPTADAQKQFDFEHKMFVESEKGYADSRVSIQKNLTLQLAEIYEQQVKDFQDYQDKASGKQGVRGWLLGGVEGISNLITTGSRGGAATSFMHPNKLLPPPGMPDLGISSQDILNARETVKRQNVLALHPDARASAEQQAFAQAVATINQAEEKYDTLDRGFEPGGKLARAQMRARNSDNPLGLLQADLADFQAQMKTGVEDAKKVVEKEQKAHPDSPQTGPALVKAQRDLDQYDDELKKKRAEISSQAAALVRRRDQQLRAVDAGVAVANVRSGVVPGNYASEIAAAQSTLRLENDKAQADFKSHLNPIQLTEERRVAAGRFAETAIEMRQRQTNAARQRSETILTEGGRFAAQGALNDPRLSTQQALIKGYAAEMEAASHLSNDEERRNQQLQLTLRLRESLVEAARKEASEVAETNIAKYSNQVELQEMVARIQGGRGTKSQDQQAAEAIERRRQLERSKAQEAYSERLSTGSAGDEPHLARQRDEAFDQADKQAAAATLERLERARDVRRQELAEVYQRQGQHAEKMETTQTRGPADELAAINNVHQIRLQYIDQEFEARGKTIDAEKDRRKSMLDEDLRYSEQIQETLKQRYEEARSFSGGLFDAVSKVKTEPFAVPRFFGDFIKGQGKTVFENVASPIVNSTFSNISKSFGGQFTTDASGKQVPTALGRVLGGTVFGATPPQDPAKALADVTKESISAQTSLTQAIASLDAAVRAVGGLPASTAGAAAVTSSAGATAVGNPLNALSTLLPGAAPLIKTATAVMRIPQATGLFGGGGAPGVFGGGTADMSRAVAAMDPQVRQALGGTAGVLSTIGGSVNPILNLLGGSGTLAAGAQPSGGGVTINVAPPELTGLGPAIGGPNLGFSPSISDYANIAAPSALVGGGPPIRMADDERFGAITNNGNGMLIGGLASGTGQIGQNYSPVSGFPQMMQNGSLVTPPSGRNVVGGYVQPPPPVAQSLAAGFGGFASAFGNRSNLQGVFTGHEDVPGKEPGTAEVNQSTAQRVGGAIGAAGTVIGGTEMAIQGFNKGSAKGDLQGIGGILSAASIIPGPQQPFVMAGAALTGLISSFLPDPKAVRQAQIDSYLQTDAYRAPVSVDATIAASGGALVSEGLTGLARNTGMAAFPFNIQQNQLQAQSNPSILGTLFGTKDYTNSLYPYAQGYNYLPGRQLAPSDVAATGAYGGGMPGGAGVPLYGTMSSYISPSAAAAMPSAPAPTNITVNMPISAMDSQDVMRRSPDIAAAVSKELRGGGGVSDLGTYINQSIFGGG